MKTSKILLFIFVVISVLTFIAFIYPTKGIQIGSLDFQFPSPENIINRSQPEAKDPEAILEKQIIKKIDSLQHELKDTLNYYLDAMVHPTRFYLPNDDYTFFDNFFKEAENAKGMDQIIRVIHYGDSQIELDRISSNIRKYFQSQFGGSGPGLLPLYQSIPTATVYQNFSGNYVTYALYGDGIRNKTKDYGVMAKSFKLAGGGSFYASAPGAEKKNSKNNPYSRIKLLFNNQNSTLKASLSHKNKGTIKEQEFNNQGLQYAEWRLDTAISNFSIHFSGSSNIYGILVDGGAGVAVDNVPMRGASGTFFTQMNDTLLQSSFNKMGVKMIILQFGGNSVPGLYNEKSADQYIQSLIAQIKYFKRLFPKTPILFIGPSDMATKVKGVMSTYPLLPYLVEQLKVAVPANGAAFWNMYEVMGGENSMLGWVKKGWAGSDYVHFTPQGAAKIGDILVQTFSTMYEFYELRKHNPNSHFEEVYQKIKTEHAKTHPKK